MENKGLIEKISRKIKESKKYKSVYNKTIERIVESFVHLKNEKVIEKKSKNLLHQIWGAFYDSRPDFSKVLEKLAQNDVELNAEKRGNEKLKEVVLPILNFQSSVKERVPILEKFYQKIFQVTGSPNSVADYACGLNPLTYFWMGLPEGAQYKAFDIDQEEVGFLKSAFKLFGAGNVSVGVGDVLCDKLEYADVVFLLKLLPCLEHQKKDSGIELLKRLDCKYMVVSFPVKSLGGKKSGMADFYSNNFKSVIEKEGWQATELLFDTELVFVIKSKI